MAESHGDAKGTTAHTEADGGHKARVSAVPEGHLCLATGVAG